MCSSMDSRLMMPIPGTRLGDEKRCSSGSMGGPLEMLLLVLLLVVIRRRRVGFGIVGVGCWVLGW